MAFLDTIAEPLAELMQAAARWLDAQTALAELDEHPVGPVEPMEPVLLPKWRMNDRGGFDPVDPSA